MDKLTPEKRSWNMSRIRGRDTQPELIVRSMLHHSGYRFRVAYKNLPGKPDIVLPKYKTAIFINGCFWHRHKGCQYAYTPKSRVKFWRDKFSGNIKRDQSKISTLKLAGWLTIIIWECRIKHNADLVREHVIQKLQQRLKKQDVI